MTHPNPFPPQWQPPTAPPPKTPFWRSKKGAAVLLGGGLLAAVVVAGNSGGQQTTQNRPGVPSGVDPTAWNPTPAAAPGGLTVETWTIPAAETGPLTSFSSGTYEVGTAAGQVPPGKYKSPGPDAGGICYSARLKHNDGALGDIIDNDVSQGPAILNVKASDGYVEVSGCTFTKAG